MRRNRDIDTVTTGVTRSRIPRDHWERRIEQLDPVADAAQVYGITVRHEFPWDMNQALSFALFRTYAVPSIGVLLHDTGQFTQTTQKRYDDTALILDHIGEHGLASAHYYRDLGRHLGIRDVPQTWQDFGSHMDAYEAEHFAFDERARAVADTDATLALMATFPPNHRAPAAAVVRFSRASMDEPLLDAFRYPHPTAAERSLAHASLRARNAWLRRRSPRLAHQHARDVGNVRSYPDGYDVAGLGTFSPWA